MSLKNKSAGITESSPSNSEIPKSLHLPTSSEPLSQPTSPESHINPEALITDQLALTRDYIRRKAANEFDTHEGLTYEDMGDGTLFLKDSDGNELIKYSGHRYGYDPRTKQPLPFSDVTIGFKGKKEIQYLDILLDYEGFRQHTNRITKHGSEKWDKAKSLKHSPEQTLQIVTGINEVLLRSNESQRRHPDISLNHNDFNLPGYLEWCARNSGGDYSVDLFIRSLKKKQDRISRRKFLEFAAAGTGALIGGATSGYIGLREGVRVGREDLSSVISADLSNEVAVEAAAEKLKKYGVSDFLPLYVSYNRLVRSVGGMFDYRDNYYFQKWFGAIQDILTENEPDPEVLEEMRSGWESQITQYTDEEIEEMVSRIEISSNNPDEDIELARRNITKVAKTFPFVARSLERGVFLRNEGDVTKDNVLGEYAAVGDGILSIPSYKSSEGLATKVLIHEASHALDDSAGFLKEHVRLKDYLTFQTERLEMIRAIFEEWVSFDPQKFRNSMYSNMLEPIYSELGNFTLSQEINGEVERLSKYLDIDTKDYPDTELETTSDVYRLNCLYHKAARIALGVAGEEMTPKEREQFIRKYHVEGMQEKLVEFLLHKTVDPSEIMYPEDLHYYESENPPLLNVAMRQLDVRRVEMLARDIPPANWTTNMIRERLAFEDFNTLSELSEHITSNIARLEKEFGAEMLLETKFRSKHPLKVHKMKVKEQGYIVVSSKNDIVAYHIPDDISFDDIYYRKDESIEGVDPTSSVADLHELYFFEDDSRPLKVFVGTDDIVLSVDNESIYPLHFGIARPEEIKPEDKVRIPLDFSYNENPVIIGDDLFANPQLFTSEEETVEVLYIGGEQYPFVVLDGNPIMFRRLTPLKKDTKNLKVTNYEGNTLELVSNSGVQFSIYLIESEPPLRRDLEYSLKFQFVSNNSSSNEPTYMQLVTLIGDGVIRLVGGIEFD